MTIEMILQVAVANFLLAVIILAVIMYFLKASNSKRRWYSYLMWFIGIWIFITVIGVQVDIQSFGSSAVPILPPDGDKLHPSPRMTGQYSNMRELVLIPTEVINGRHVDKQLHDHFWTLMRSTSPEQSTQMSIIAQVNNGMQFQQDFWQCMLATSQQHEIAKIQPCVSAVHSVNGIDLTKTRAMLRAAALSIPYKLSNGRTVIFNESSAQIILTRLRRSSEQLSELLNPIWPGSGSNNKSQNFVMQSPQIKETVYKCENMQGFVTYTLSVAGKSNCVPISVITKNK
ncbi:MAG: hypothetical protein ACYCUI_16575 [Vulcanimicrobiaceae bacterium]|jgi:archaellin